MNWFWTGMLLVLAGGVMQGSFGLPQKYVRGWSWERNWLYYCASGMVVFPCLLVALVVPNALTAYANAGAGALARTALFGMGWGVGAVLFGLGMASVGVALAFALIISLTAVVGSLGPLLVLHPDQALSARGALLVVGLALVIAGVILCSKAGTLREAASKAVDGGAPRKGGSFARGLAICVASGITSPMMNFAFTFGTPISIEAVRLGADPANASLAIFAVAMGTGFLINTAYCLHLLARNKSWAPVGPAEAGRNTFHSVAMGFLWYFGFYFYGLGATKLGEWGAVAGWPIFMTVMVLMANFWGIFTGEWKGAPRAAMRYLGCGIAVMIAALVVIAAGNRS